MIEILVFLKNLLLDYLQQEIKENWEIALSTVLKHERLNDDEPNITKYGVSLAFLKESGIDVNLDGIIDDKDIIDLNKENAEKILKEKYWYKNNYHKIEDKNIAALALDFAVALGAQQINKLIQIAYNRLVEDGVLLKTDGNIGHKSLNAINNLVDSEVLFLEIKKNIEHFYINLAADYPAVKEFLNDWFRRINDHVFNAYL